MTGTTGDLIHDFIYYFGWWEPVITRWVQSRLLKRDVFIDIGANTGYYSLLASDLVGSEGSVIAIEACPATFSKLVSNLSRNQVYNARPVNVAVWDRPATLSLFAARNGDSGITSVVPEWADERDCSFAQEVPALPFGQIVRDAELKSSRLIKIDVEGAEWQVAMGMRDALALTRTDIEILLEVTPSVLSAQNLSAGDLIEFFADFGFHPYSVENDYDIDKVIAYTTRSTHLPRPVRNEGPILEQTDIVFSRIDAAQL